MITGVKAYIISRGRKRSGRAIGFFRSTVQRTLDATSLWSLIIQKQSFTSHVSSFPTPTCALCMTCRSAAARRSMRQHRSSQIYGDARQNMKSIREPGHVSTLMDVLDQQPWPIERAPDARYPTTWHQDARSPSSASQGGKTSKGKNRSHTCLVVGTRQARYTR